MVLGATAYNCGKVQRTTSGVTGYSFGSHAGLAPNVSLS